MTRIYHLARHPDWEAALESGPYRGGATDRADGFIHFSTAGRLAESAALYCAGVADLMVVAVDAESLGAALRWEAARGGEAFPHLYGPLPPEAVIWVEAAPLDADGRHRLPALT
jgi:uncharacterized protein (DUF952 family)